MRVTTLNVIKSKILWKPVLSIRECKDIQYWILWYSICTWQDYLSIDTFCLLNILTDNYSATKKFEFFHSVFIILSSPSSFTIYLHTGLFNSLVTNTSPYHCRHFRGTVENYISRNNYIFLYGISILMSDIRFFDFKTRIRIFYPNSVLIICIRKKTSFFVPLTVFINCTLTLDKSYAPPNTSGFSCGCKKSGFPPYKEERGWWFYTNIPGYC